MTKIKVYDCKSCDNSGVVQYLDSSGDDFIIDYCPNCLEGLRAKNAECKDFICNGGRAINLKVSFTESEGNVPLTRN